MTLDLDGKSATFNCSDREAWLMLQVCGGRLGVSMTLEQAEELGLAMYLLARKSRRSRPL